MSAPTKPSELVQSVSRAEPLNHAADCNKQRPARRPVAMTGRWVGGGRLGRGQRIAEQGGGAHLLGAGQRPEGETERPSAMP